MKKIRTESIIFLVQKKIQSQVFTPVLGRFFDFSKNHQFWVFEESESKNQLVLGIWKA